MPPIRSTALRGAIIIPLFAAACGETAVEPRSAPVVPRREASSILVTRSFSGRAADSVLNVLGAAWAKRGRTHEHDAILAWRKRNGVPDSVRDSAVAPPQIMPNVNLDVVASGVERPQPQVLSHTEQLHWGLNDLLSTALASIEAEMTFIGDHGEIRLSNLKVTATRTGATYTTSGLIASGAGDLIGCSDAVFGSCSNRRNLRGVMTLAGAPYCDATSSGNISYIASYVTVSTTPGLFGSPSSTSTGDTQSPTPLSAGIQGSAPACDTQQPPPSAQQPQGDGPTDPAGGPPEASPPAPWTPPDGPSGPPPSVRWYCGTVTYYQTTEGDTRLLGEIDVCYPD
jgi:hypothetical protein